MDLEIEKIVKKLGLKKLWDKDFISEEHSSDILFEVPGLNKTRPLYNWAYYLIPEGCIFPLHKLLSDESWQYCLGGPVDLFLIHNGEIETVRVGSNIFDDEKLYYVVKKNTWFAATPAPHSKFTLLTHCVSPGWVPEDDIPGYYDDMLKLAPNHRDFIEKFSWPKSRNPYFLHKDYQGQPS